MRNFIFFLVVFIYFSSCIEKDERLRIVPVEFLIHPHNSNNEIYARVPMGFGVKEIGVSTGSFYELEIYVNGDQEDVSYFQYAFPEPGNYQVRALVKMTDKKVYEFDTVIHVDKGPPLLGDPERGEKVLFGWTTGVNSSVLMSTYHGTSVHDYEVLAIDESLIQQGALTKINVDWYPDFIDYGATASGKLVIIYDDELKIFDAALAVNYQFSYGYNQAPRKILMQEDHAVLLFDSMDYVTLRKLDTNTGQIVEGARQYMGVNEMTIYNHFFQDEMRIASYYVAPNNATTLLMGVEVGSNTEYSRYFQPPVFIDNVTPILSGGYVINTTIGEGRNMSILGADGSNVIKWSRTFMANSRNYGYQIPDGQIIVKELEGFIYVFFDNMRCIKLTPDGQLIWDKFFYPDTARLQDVLITSNNEFIMLGTCVFPYSNTDIDFQKRSDVLCIKINTDGFRII